jgi:hypothetical protein
LCSSNVRVKVVTVANDIKDSDNEESGLYSCIADNIFESSQHRTIDKLNRPAQGNVCIYPRSLLILHFVQRASLNIPLGNSYSDSRGGEESYGNCRPSGPRGRLGLGAALLIVGALCIGEGVYKLGESLALNLRETVLAGFGGIVVIQGVLLLLELNFLQS